MTVRIIGYNLSHDSSICLVEDGVVRSALALERTTRVKRGVLPPHAYASAMADLTRDVLDDNGLSTNDIDLWVATSTESRNPADEARLTSLLGLVATPGKCVQLPHPGHHLAHASAAFHTSGFPEAAALVIDAYGSLMGSARERETGFRFRAGELPEKVLQTVRDQDRIAGYRRDGAFWTPARLSGIGEIYRVVTLALGFSERGTVYDDAGKTMGLAAYGSRLSSDNLFIETAPGGALDFDRAAESLVELGLAVREGDELRLTTRRPGAPIEKFHQDLAAQLQAEFEQACLHVVDELLNRTGSRSLVVSGGCFLNSTLNTKLLEETDLDRLFVFPAATDDGNAVGAALYAYHHIAEQPPINRPAMTQIYLGPSRVAGRDIKALAEGCGLRARRHDERSGLTAAASEAIARGEIVGWFQDRSEFGPRALGARSILCHPGIPGMKDKLNARVKFREAFRPFAASVLAEQAEKWFDMPAPESPFMLHVCPVRPAQQTVVSEIVHVDGTCRIQTVSESTPSPFRSLIEAFERETGIPMVLNTSFNLRGMPIVERVEEALDCLYGSRLDRLFIGGFEIKAPDLETLRPVAGRHLDGGENAPAILRAVHGAEPGTSAHRLLELSDGNRTMSDVAGDLGIGVSEAVDIALELRRHGLLQWSGVPEVPLPTYPLPQFAANTSGE